MKEGLRPEYCADYEHQPANFDDGQSDAIGHDRNAPTLSNEEHNHNVGIAISLELQALIDGGRRIPKWRWGIRR
jgi:hypothetical protein